jgi:predicted DNA-binding ribbon-helix-helix protein
MHKRSVKIARHATSVSLEEEFWVALREIATRRRQPLAALIASADAKRAGNLSSSLRLLVLDSYRSGELT